MYIFTNDEETIKNIFVYSAIDMAGKRTLEFLGGYLPLLILLLCPFLALSIRLLHLKKNKPYIHYFVFSLHYTAFIEIYLLCLFGVRQLIVWVMLILIIVFLYFIISYIYVTTVG